MYATILTGAGKPKLVTISRPTSPNTKSCGNSSVLDFQDRPATPLQPNMEISAFSPDTPVEGGRRSARGSSSRPLEVTQNLRSRPLDKWFTPDRSSSERSRSSLESLGESPSRSQSTLASTPTPANYTAISSMRTPPPVSSPKIKAVGSSRRRKLERTLEAISTAIDFFPEAMLYLHSPAILQLRSPDSLDEKHIDALRYIFPSTDARTLSAIAALVIVDMYLSTLDYGDDLEDPLSPSIRETKCWRVAAESNECLYSIPTKARETLGIQLPDATQGQTNERALRRKAENVAICVGVQGQKLLGAICGRWDEVMWRMLRVIVELVEDQG